MLDKIIENAIVNNPRTLREGDYLNDEGLMVCGKCGEERQCRTTFMGEEFVVPCICKCEKMEDEKAKELAEKRHKDLRKDEEISAALRESFPDKKNGLPNERRGYTFAVDNGFMAEPMKKIREFADNFGGYYSSGKGLFIYGPSGTGKTFAACCIANELIDNQRQSVYFLKAGQFANLMTDQKNKQEFINRVCSYDLLIIDDFGAERDTTFGREQMFNLIDTRMETGLPVVITSNLPFKEIWECQDGERRRVYDRIVKITTPVEFIGKSQRKIIAAMDYKQGCNC